MGLVKFGDLVKEVKINIDRNNNPYEYYVAGDHMDSEDLTIRRKGMFATDDVGPAFTRLFKPGQILYGSRRTYLKKVAVADFEGVCSNTTFVLETKDESRLRQRLLPFIMLTEDFTKWSISKSKGSTNPYILFSDLANYEFELPDIHRQDELVELLWQAYATKESYREMIRATDDMVKSQFIEMFSGREYPQLPIRDFADITTGSTPSKSHPEYWGGSNPWVSAEDMKDKYVYDTVEKVTDKGYATCKHIPVNTLMYVCRGSIGVMAINKVECATNQSICTATCKADKCEVEFLYHSLLYKKDEIKQIGIGTNFKSLNQTTFSNLRIFLPPIEEQRRFVSITTQADKSKFELKQAIEKIDKVMRALMQ